MDKLIHSLEIENTDKSEYKETQNLVRESFWNVYRPGCVEHFLIHCLRKSPQYIPDLDFVLKDKNNIIGQIIYFPNHIDADDNRQIEVLTFGPVCIHPDYQNKGYGQYLIEQTLALAQNKGFGAVCIEGDYDFYSKLGFRYAKEFNLRYKGLEPEQDSSFFLCKELVHGYLDDISGEYAAPKDYMVKDDEVELFDKNFPDKEKKVLPGQIFG